MDNWQVLYYLTPEIGLSLVGCILLLVGAYTKKRTVIFTLALVSLLAALAVALSFLGVKATILYQSIEINTFSQLIKAVFLVLSILTLWASWDFLEETPYPGEYCTFILFATIGLMVLGSAGDLLTLFLAFELTSISTYTLPLITPDNGRGREAAVKYFITGAFSTGLVLFGISLLYGMTGSLVLTDLAQGLSRMGVQPLSLAAVALLTAGFGYKMSIAPFHLWAPDVYQGAPTPVTAFLAGITKKGAFVAGFKILLVTMVAVKLQITVILAVLAVLTMTMGNVVALMQEDLKRMMAFSSIAHAGNILVGLAVFTPLAVAGSILHITAHGLMTIGIFFGIYFVAGEKEGHHLDKWSGLRRSAPLTAAALFIILLSLAGVPPFLGFWSKMVLVLAALEAGGWYTLLALILVLNSALSLVYYARVIRVMYMDSGTQAGQEQEVESQLTETYAGAALEQKKERGSYFIGMYACALIITLVGLFPEKLVALSTAAARFIIP